MFSSRDMSGGEFLSSREFMGSDLFLNQTTTQQHQQQQQQQNQHHHQPPPQPPTAQGGGGLARYRSAPSSFLAALLDSTATENSSSGDESEAIFSALMGGQKNGGGGGGGVDDQMQFHQMKQEVAVESEPRPGSMNGQMGSVVGSYSVGMDSGVDLRMNSNTSSINLLRQSSSPAGFFNGFGVMGDVGNYRVQSHAKPNSSSANHNMNFSSGPSSSSRFMPSIPENDQLLRNRNNNNTSANNNNNNNGGREFEDVNFPQDSWNHSPPFNSLKRNRDGDPKMFSNFNGFENQNGESRKNSSGLVHHLSLPKTSNEMAEVENYLHFQQDTTPCQIRAKRGFATHPRSIAERVRRTRISEKMRKLQDLFPTMDKQTSTADMLDSAVEFIKELQKQVQTLTDIKGKCICSNKPQ